MRYLLDTHVFLWLQTKPERLGAAAHPLADRANEVLFSAVSAWEIAIKTTLGRLSLPEPAVTFVPSRVRTCGFGELAVETSHALAVVDLPSHHRDPFDRLLVAQAQLLSLTLVTVDQRLELYDVEVLRV